MAEPKNVVIIGAGAAGLACGYRLQQLKIPFTIIEKSDFAGGLVRSSEQDGFLFEAGPQSFQGTETILQLIRELGIESDLQIADARAPRYVLKHGKMQKIPMTPQALVSSSLLTTKSRWNVISEPFRRARPPGEEESVADFVRRKFGHEILEYLVAPFVSGVYAGDPEKLSLKAAFPSLDEWERAHGSVLRGAIKSRRKGPSGAPPLCSFRRGMASLPVALAQNLGPRLRTCVPAKAVRQTEASGRPGFEAEVERNGQVESIPCDAVVVATPAFVAAQLVRGISSDIARILSGIAYAPVAVVAAAYHLTQMNQPIKGFGVLIPRSEKVRTLGTVWNSSLFPDRAPRGLFTLTSFAGGATDPEIVSLSEPEIADIVHADNSHILGISGLPARLQVWRYERGLPQYNLGHGHIVAAIERSMGEIPGLFFAGNYMEGPSIGKCIETGFRTAESINNGFSAGR
jgi:oxygen-dependent protoporphyrinogen oxidase